MDHKWSELPMIFTSDEVTGENHLQIASLVTKKSLITAKNISFYSLHAIFVLNTQFRLKQLSIADFAIVVNDGLFWLSIVTSPHLICDVTRRQGTGISDLVLWRHHIWFVTPHEGRVLALWRDIHLLLLHAQIGSKAIFTSESQP